MICSMRETRNIPIYTMNMERKYECYRAYARQGFIAGYKLMYK